MNTLGRTLRRLRRHRNWSYRDLSYHSGVSHQNLYVIEKGNQSPTLDTLRRIAGAFHLSVAQLIGDQEISEKSV